MLSAAEQVLGARFNWAVIESCLSKVSVQKPLCEPPQQTSSMVGSRAVPSSWRPHGDQAVLQAQGDHRGVTVTTTHGSGGRSPTQASYEEDSFLKSSHSRGSYWTCWQPVQFLPSQLLSHPASLTCSGGLNQPRSQELQRNYSRDAHMKMRELNMWEDITNLL